ncbi:MAG TPA: hypothetical protein VJ793_19265 [Anaerolineae bacterium]|nr:hypothetical protein [Anaerolineae bacterium]
MANSLGFGVKFLAPIDTLPDASAERKVPLKRLLMVQLGELKWVWEFPRLRPSVPVQVRSMSTLATGTEESRTKTGIVVFNLAELSRPKTWKSGSANGAKPKASKDAPVLQSNWEIKMLAPDDELPGPGGAWNVPSLAKTPTKTAIHPSVLKKKASANRPLKRIMSPAKVLVTARATKVKARTSAMKSLLFIVVLLSNLPFGKA